MSYETVIGLEVHVQLKTATKMFCRCPNRYGLPPNTLICPVCLGYPGALPVANRAAVDLAVRLALALDARVHERSLFARKHYFYPDLPKGYQISQYEQPLAEGGRLPLSHHETEIAIERLHLEEDAGKLTHDAPSNTADGAEVSRVDFNRCGVPLVEIVSAPELRSPAEAQDFLQTLRQLLLYTQVSDGNMEEGSLRCDANISLRRRGETSLGTRTEIKNLSSFRHLGRALEHEAQRQARLLDQGRRIVSETRGFDAEDGTTHTLRRKEGEDDYRYFVEPDLPPLTVSSRRLEEARRSLPELPWTRRRRFIERYGLRSEDAHLLTTTRELADYYELATRAHPQNPLGVANWIKTEILRGLKERDVGLDRAVAPERLAKLVALVDDGALSSSGAKQVLDELWRQDDAPGDVARRLGLVQIRDDERLQSWVDEAIDGHPRQAEEYKAGKVQLLGFFVGQVMRLSQGRADPRSTRRLLELSLQRRTLS